MSSTSGYKEIYPSPPLLDSDSLARPSVADLLTLEYFEAEPGEMPTRVFEQHHLLLNLREEPQYVENWRDGEHREFLFKKGDIIVTPAGISSGWRWHGRSNVIVILLEKDKFESFASKEVGVLLAENQLRNMPQFSDMDICNASIMLRDALVSKEVGHELLFESLARVFLVKLIQRYGDVREEDVEYARGFTSKHYKRVADFIANNYGRHINLDDLAAEAALSPSHFSRSFKKTLGQTPMHFLMAYRVEQARKQIQNPELSFTQIAASCGFSDQAHFSRVFKQAQGVSPKQYRASLLERE